MLAPLGPPRYRPRQNPFFPFKQDVIMAVQRTFSIIKPDATERNL
ncbi:MAG TPA: nucleoside-diphosphate kinase, partial [Hyphomonas sp.]|nr:nucleoside-diphosphate kinase [Hyphomonas sp.]